MRFLAFSLMCSLLCVVPTPAQAATPGGNDEVEASLHGLEPIRRKIERTTSSTRKLALLDRELEVLRRAYARVRLQDAQLDSPRALRVERRMIRALNDKTRIYLERGSLVQAQRANRAALAYRTTDTQALNFRFVLQRARTVDLTDQAEGTTAIDRLQERRASIGQPLRDRGMTRRR